MGQNLGQLPVRVGTGKCLFCGKKNRKAIHKYCSPECAAKDKIGRHNDWGWKIGKALRGKKKSPEHIKNAADARRGKRVPSMQGEKHWLWKGEKASYDSIHDWVARYKGRPKLCEHCGLKDPKRMYHWANKSKKYLRDLDDWVRLCVPCHSKFDRVDQ